MPGFPGGLGGGYMWGSAGQVVITGPTLNLVAGTYNVAATTTNIRVSSGAVTLNLPSVAQGVQDGQQLFVVTFDTSGNATVINAAAGDNILGGPSYNLASYAATVTLQARVAGGVANWLVVACNTFTTLLFPTQPTLVAGAQGPLPLGSIILPQGPRYMHSVWGICAAALSAGQLTLSITGMFATPSTYVINSPNQSLGTLYAPGNANRITVPNTGAGGPTLLTATVTTTAAFAGGVGPFAALMTAY
jgi:hypothetical protein